MYRNLILLESHSVFLSRAVVWLVVLREIGESRSKNFTRFEKGFGMGIDYNKNREDRFIYRFLRPDNNDTSHVTLLLLHGTGGDENNLIDFGRELLPKAAILSPRGKVLEHGMPRFFRRLAEGVFDIPDLHKRTTELADFIQAASIDHNFDPQRVVAVGFSNGANIAGSMLLQHPNVLAAALLLSPMVPFEPEQLPDLKGKPVFIGAGLRDTIAEPDNTRLLIEILTQSGADLKTFWTNSGHGITQGEFNEAKAWIQRLPL
jgi:phospholipase/carboxylesterase